MAETERSNLPIAEEPEFTTEIPAIRPDDLVHFAQMNAMLESLLGNDVFLQRLANKMIENSLIAHVLDCENPQMVLGADQAPVITGLIDGVKEDVTQLYSDIGYKKLQFGQYALRTNAPGEYEVTIPFHHPFNGIPVITIGFGVPNKNFEGYGDSHLVICNEKTTKNGFVVCLKTKYVSDCVYAINWVAIV